MHRLNWKVFLLETSSTSVKLPIEIIMKEVQPVVATKYEFEWRDELK